MANDVFANNREISCKAADGKSICAFPDVCMTPPENPATPPGVPIPYPNTGMASDTTDGSRSVHISGKEIMLKNRSYFKKSIGDEAGCAAKKGVVSSVNRGKVYFIAWSMDVKVEGENAVRHFDMTTHNHASPTANSPPWPFIDSAALEPGDDENRPCAKYASAIKEKCPPPSSSKARGADFSGGLIVKTPRPGPQDNTSPECCDARKCMLVPEKPKSRCAKCGKTPHHPLPAAELLEPRTPRALVRAGATGQARGAAKVGRYKPGKAPCVCVDGDDHDEREVAPPFRLKEHGRLGAEFAKQRNDQVTDPNQYTYSKAGNIAANAAAKITGCDEKCIKQQLDNGHHAMGVNDGDVLRMSKQKADVPETLPPSAAPSA